jgi:CBS-domain-containing membrane protein
MRMIQTRKPESLHLASGPEEAGEIELADADILEAMREIHGYLDISTADFRDLYHLAYHHAMDRMFHGITARRLMRAAIHPLAPDTRLADAIPLFVSQGLKTLPVVDPEGRVLGILTETDVLRAFGAASFLALVERLMTEPGVISPDQCRRPVSELMTSPAVSVPLDAGFRQLVAAFTSHSGRGMPVQGPDGRLAGLLLRKQFLNVCHMEGPA